MPYETTEYRGIEIRYAYSIHTDGYRANFTLPLEGRSRPAFPWAMHMNLREAVDPGKNHADADTADAAIEFAHRKIDSYLNE